MRCRGMTRRASSSRPGFSHRTGVLESERSMLRKRRDLLSVGGAGTMGRLRREAVYEGGGDMGVEVEGCRDGAPGAAGGSRDGRGGTRVDAGPRCDCGGGEDGADGLEPTVRSVGRRDDGLLRDPGRLLNWFMRLVDRVRRNMAVKSSAQPSGSGAGPWGTGLRRGIALRSAMLVRSRPDRRGTASWWCCLEGRRWREECATRRSGEGVAMTAGHDEHCPSDDRLSLASGLCAMAGDLVAQCVVCELGPRRGDAAGRNATEREGELVGLEADVESDGGEVDGGRWTGGGSGRRIQSSPPGRWRLDPA